jgi:NADPH:quinone reductase-like Zn-dependent oxidoreductase
MRAAFIESYGQTPTVTDLPELEHDLPIATMVAAGLNPVDLTIAGGEYYAIRPKPPYTPGVEGVARRADGKLVYFMRPGDLKHGSLAEQVVLNEEESFELTDETDPAAAISCGIAGLAAWLSLMDRGGLQAGEKVVINGATGAAGRIAIQAAKLAGASQVVAVGRSAERLERCKELGADETLRFHGPTYLHEVELRKLTDGGQDLTIDFLWDHPGIAALNAGAKNARFIQVGNAAGLGAGMPASILRAGNYTLKGFSVWNETRETKEAGFNALLDHVKAGRIQLDTELVALEDVPDAWVRQGQSPGSKLVVQIG